MFMIEKKDHYNLEMKNGVMILNAQNIFYKVLLVSDSKLVLK